MSEATVEVVINGTRQKLTLTAALEAKAKLGQALDRSRVKCMACGGLTLPFEKCTRCGCTR